MNRDIIIANDDDLWLILPGSLLNKLKACNSITKDLF